MKLHNTTAIPEATIREVLRYVSPRGVTNVDVHIGNRSWGAGSGWASRRGRVLIRLQQGAKYPIRWAPDHASGYVFDDWIRSKEEMLVMLLAHEMRHEWQYGRGQSIEESIRRHADRPAFRAYHPYNLQPQIVKARRAPATRRRGQKGGRERDADRYAMRMLRSWRRDHPVAPAWAAASIQEI